MLTKQIKLKHGITELGNLQVKIISILCSLLFISTLAFGELTEQVSLKHGVSENGNLQVYLVTKINENTKLLSSNRSIAYTPVDTSNMEGWDERSKKIVEVITNADVIAAFNLEKQEMTGIGLEKIITYDRIIEADGRMPIRQIIRVFKGGKEIDKKYHRSWINPGDSLENRDVISKALAMEIHTEKVIAEYEAEKVKRELESK